MKQWRIAAAALVLALLAGFLIFPLRRPRPVLFQGKPVLAWALELNGPGPIAPAQEVFRQVGEEAVPVLARALEKKDSFLRKPLMVVAPKLPDKPRIRLTHWLDPDEANRLRLGAACALEIMGPKAKQAVPALGKALRDEDPNIAMRAAFALAGIGQEAVPELVKALKAPRPHTRLMAIYAFGRIGADASAAIPALVEALEDQSPEIPERAAQTLGRLGRTAVPKLLPLLKHPRAAVRGLAVASLAEMGPLARPALPDLLASLGQEQVATVRKGIVEALGKIRPSAENVVLALIQALQDEDSGVRAKAAEALERGAHAAGNAVPALIGALNDRSPDVRKSAAAALGSIGAAAHPARAKLAEMASHPNEPASAHARDALEKIKASQPAN